MIVSISGWVGHHSRVCSNAPCTLKVRAGHSVFAHFTELTGFAVPDSEQTRRVYLHLFKASPQDMSELPLCFLLQRWDSNSGYGSASGHWLAIRSF